MSPYLEILGKKIRDRVTGRSGVATSVSFDLFGCVQVIIQPEDKGEKEPKAYFYDFSRCEITDENRVMPIPDYGKPPIEGRLPSRVASGPADKGDLSL